MYVIYMHLEVSVEDAELVKIVRGQYDMHRVENKIWLYRYGYRRFIYTVETSTHAQGTDPRVALGA